MPVFRKRVRDAFMVISVFSEWPESLGSLAVLCQKHYLTSRAVHLLLQDTRPPISPRPFIFPHLQGFASLDPFCLLIYRDLTTNDIDALALSRKKKTERSFSFFHPSDVQRIPYFFIRPILRRRCLSSFYLLYFTISREK